MRIAFVWQGITGVYGRWNDGLRGAMDIIEKQHTVTYHEPKDDIKDVDVILYWEAPCTVNGPYRDNYLKVMNNPIKKCLLFAGGPMLDSALDFDLIFVESAINEDELKVLGRPFKRAFGVNTKIFHPEKQPKVFDACFPATCAGWKRQALFSKALGAKGVLCGRGQEADPYQFIQARENGTLLLPELPYEAINSLYNASHTCVNTSEFWGGGQRTTLEAMAAGIPVIVMEDSPKNREYVEESGAGIICKPEEAHIRKAIEDAKMATDMGKKGIAYVLSKWTSEHYAHNILEGINSI